MTIGLCRIDLYLPDCGSLKQKRSVLKGLMARIRNKFNVSIAELGEQDLWQKALVGVVVIANESRYANQVLSKAVDLIQNEHQVILMDYTMEMF